MVFGLAWLVSLVFAFICIFLGFIFKLHGGLLESKGVFNIPRKGPHTVHVKKSVFSDVSLR